MSWAYLALQQSGNTPVFDLAEVCGMRALCTVNALLVRLRFKGSLSGDSYRLTAVQVPDCGAASFDLN